MTGWFQTQWNALWDTTGIQMESLVGHTQHAITVMGHLFQMILGNPFFVMMLIFALLGSGVRLFGRMRRSVR